MIPSLRRLRHAPAAYPAIVLTLGLGIGATTAIFSVVNGVLLQPLPIPEAERVVMLWQRAPGVGVAEDWFSPAQYFDLREGAGSFESIALAFGREVTLTADGIEPERVGALEVSSSWFDVLRVPPALGRPLDRVDDRVGAPRRVLLSHAFFRQRFGGDPAILGTTLRYDGAEAEILGVLPPELVLDADLVPTLNTVPGFDLLLALPMEDPGGTTRGSENYNILARLTPSATPARLEADLLGLAEAFRRDPGSLAAGLEAGSGFRIDAVPLLEQVAGSSRLPLLVLLAATALLLVAACANAANLLLTRSVTQRRELGIRAALGAGRGQLVRRALLRSLGLATASGAVGVLMAALAILLLHLAAPPDLPRLRDVALDGPVLVFAAGLVLVSTLLFGTVPAIRAGRVDPVELMHGTATAVRARSVWRDRGSQALVAAQVAISLLLIAGAMLLGRSFLRLQTVDPGLDPASTLTWRVALAGEEYDEPGARVRFFERLHRGLAMRPGVGSVGGVAMLPFTRGYAWTDFVVEGQRVVDARDRIVADLHVVTPGYFEAVGARLLAGRTLTDGDDIGIVLVNRAFAERFWSVEETVGRWLARDEQEERATIVGVIDDIRHYGLGEAVRPAVFYPHARYPTRALYGALRAEGREPAAMAEDVADAVRALDPGLPVYDVRTMATRVAASLTRERLLMGLVGLFAVVAVVIAAVGLYGVLSFAVASHVPEIGIRRALGAQSADLYRLVLGGAGAIVAAGVVLGLGGVLAGGGVVRGLLHGVGPGDPFSVLLAVGLVLAVAVVAAVIPARRATRIDPMEALRAE